MKFIKSYKLYESVDSIEYICKKYEIENYTINSDGSIDVNGYSDFTGKNLTKIPLKIRYISGNFYFFNNKLTTLEGSPESVGGNFYVYDNKLTTLEGSPKSVGGDYYCHNNQLTTLECGPKSVGGDFYCFNNQIVNLKGFPEYYEGNVYYSGNPVSEILDLFATNTLTTEPSKLGRIIDLINEYDVIQNSKIIEDRLLEVFHILDMEMPKNLNFQNYEII
jgi:hypothetical protein